MSSLSSSSTMAEIEAALMDNASFEEDASTSKAQALITAGNLWLIKRPASAGRDGNNLTLNVNHVQMMINQARAYITAAGRTSTGSTKFLSPTGDFR